MRALLLFVTLSALRILGSGTDKMGRKWQSLKALTQGHRLPRAARLLRETELKSALKAPSSGILHHSYRPCTLTEVDGGDLFGHPAPDKSNIQHWASALPSSGLRRVPPIPASILVAF